jgi:hypothetical protein
MLALPVAAAEAAEFGVEKFVAINCSEGHESCGSSEIELAPTLKYSFPKEPKTPAESKAEGETQAGGHVPFGVTDFKVNTEGAFPNEAPAGGVVTHIRTDVAPGLATSPAAVKPCSLSEFNGKAGELAGTTFYQAPECPGESLIGVNKVTVYAGPNGVAPGVSDLPLEGNVYNLVQKEGLASEFGVALKLPKPLTEKILSETPYKGTPFEKLQYYAHTLIEGSVEWGKEEKGTNQGDYHDYFEINVSPTLPLITSRLVFKGTVGEGDFITNATSCPGNNTTRLALTNKEGKTAPPKPYTTLVGLEGCNLVPFEPTFGVAAATTANDQPNGLTAEIGLTRFPKANEVDSSELKTAVVQLPAGMTLNESAAAGLTACTPAQARIHSSTAGVACPASSQLGTVKLEVPQLPPGSLAGNIYLGGPESGPITGPPYIVYVDAESARYGVSVRLKGETIPNEATGQLTTIFSENPEQPFTKVILHFKEGALAPIANPLVCGVATSLSTLTPFSGNAAKTPSSSFTVDSNGKGGACSAPPPFTLTQSSENSAGNAGGHTTTTFNLVRPSGNQFLSRVKTTLPAGLVGAIPAVVQCPEAQASAGTCPSTSQIGTATVEAGAGPTPFQFKGPVYLTGPYSGAPFGMSIAIAAVAGPFNLGTVVTRATVNVDPHSARVVVEATLPRIVKAVGKASSGILLRLQKVSVAVNKQGFLFNPTNCSALSTETTAYAFTAANAAETATFNLASPFQVANCNKLAFKPAFKAASGARTSKANGASLETTIDQPAGQANVKSVTVQLPLQLPSRLTTLQQACLAATFEANPFKCPSGSFVGGVRANTPTLPSKMTGPAILVSHANAAFPDLDLVLQANGVRVIVVGNTDIKKGITTTKFATVPDAPVSSVTVNLPIGPHSALAAFGNLCAKRLVMPTTIVGQNGVTTKQNTRVNVRGCPVRIVRHHVSGSNAFITVQAFEGGRISGSGATVRTVYRHVRGAATITLRVPLSRRGEQRSRPFRTRVRIGFVPSKRGERTSTAFVTLTF